MVEMKWQKKKDMQKNIRIKNKKKKKWKDTDDWETIESNRSTPILLT